MRKKSAQPDRRVAEIAARQHGVVAVNQLREAGLSEAAILRRQRAGRLHRVHRGVYAVGHRALSLEGKWMAAVLAYPEGTVLSHRDAAALWGLLRPTGGPVDVSIPSRGGRRSREGIRVHRRGALLLDHVTRRRGIPVTTSARTIADLRPVVSAEEYRRAIRQAEMLGFATGLDGPGDRTGSELEHRFLRLCRRHRLPPPDVNVRVGPLTVDFLWRKQRLVVETDGYRYHRGRAAFEGDRARDLELRGRGYEVVRLSYRQVVGEEKRVAEVLRAALRGRRSWR